MEEVINGILIREVEAKNIMTKSSLPVGGYSVNPYVGCTHACKYCYASFMKRFTGHKEEWGTFLDVKHWPEIKNPKKYAGQRVVIGSVTDGYNPQEEQFIWKGLLCSFPEEIHEPSDHVRNMVQNRHRGYCSFLRPEMPDFWRSY